MIKALALHLGQHKQVLYDLSYATGATLADHKIDVDGGIGTMLVERIVERSGGSFTPLHQLCLEFRDLLLHPGQVFLPGGAVTDNPVAEAHAVYDQVIDHTAVFVQHAAIQGTAFHIESVHIVGQHVDRDRRVLVARTGIVRRNRRVVHRVDREGHRRRRGLAIAVRHRVGHGIRAREVRVRRVGQRAVAIVEHAAVRGRADGYDPKRNRLEEVKTFRGDLDLMPANHRALHWAQAKIYGWLLCAERGLDELELALVYFDIVKQKETPLRETHSAEDLRAFFETQCEIFIHWADQELAHRDARDQALADLAFPHERFRPGQRELAEAVYQSASTGRCLLTEAPTGIGKTVGTLFPLLKAMPGQKLDKIFYLSAKTPGRKLALDALETLDPAPLRTLELVAREKSCEHPDKACHGESCPLAQGFYDRLPAARAAAAKETRLTQTRLRELALDHSVCPYYLSQEMARWSDLVVGDYNYYFDLSALLHGLTTTNQWRVAVLADEAHNLVERGRGMYSAELDQAAFFSSRSSRRRILPTFVE